MNRKQFIILVVIVVLVGAAAWVIYQRGNSSWQSAGHTIGGKLLPGLPVNDVAQMTIQSGTNHLTLARRNNVWCVRDRGNYPADFSQISDLLVKLSGLKVVQNDDAGSSDLARLNLLPTGAPDGSGTLLVLQDQNGKTVASLLLGKQHMNQPANGEGWPDGRYVIANSNNTDVAVVSESFDSVSPNPANWLDKTFFKVENPKSISAAFPVATNSWTLTRASLTNDWKLANARPGEKLDSSKVDDVTDSFDSPSFNDVSPGASAPTNAVAVTMETFDGARYLAKIWPSGEDNYSMTISMDPAKPDQKTATDNQFANWTYQVSGYTVESLLKPRSNFLLPKTVAKDSK